MKKKSCYIYNKRGVFIYFFFDKKRGVLFEKKRRNAGQASIRLTNT